MKYFSTALLASLFLFSLVGCNSLRAMVDGISVEDSVVKSSSQSPPPPPPMPSDGCNLLGGFLDVGACSLASSSGCYFAVHPAGDNCWIPNGGALTVPAPQPLNSYYKHNSEFGFFYGDWYWGETAASTTLNTTEDGMTDVTEAAVLKKNGIRTFMYVPVNVDHPELMDASLAAFKNRLDSNPDLRDSIAYLTPGEEWYTKMQQGHLDSYEMFQGQPRNLWPQIMKNRLEIVIDKVKKYFPDIPVTLVENRWNYTSHPPPSNLDVLTIDAYFIPTGSECGGMQKEKFDSEVKILVEHAATLGRPVLMIGGAFQWAIYRVPEVCQLQWYHDVAKTTPQVLGIQWAIYPDDGLWNGVLGLRNPAFTSQKNYLLDWGRNVAAKKTTGSTEASPSAAAILAVIIASLLND